MENHQSINIMVCDDDREIAGAIEIYLRNEGYNVFKAFDGVEALNTARRENLHLIIMDVMMPQMDGIQERRKEYSNYNAFRKVRRLRQNNGSERRSRRLCDQAF